MSSLSAIAKRYIKPTENEKTVFYTDADVKDIIKVILHADTLSNQFTKRFAPFLKGRSDKQTLKNIWSFVRDYIEYKKDESGDEVIKSPGKTWADKTADCKSMSVMVGSLLKNLGYEYYYRVAFYSNLEQGHIYPIAILKNGDHVVVDAVHFVFDEEVPFWQSDDYDSTTANKRTSSAIAGIQKNNWQPLAFLAAVGAFVYFNKKKENDKSKLHTRCDG